MPCSDANTPPLGSADRFVENLARAGGFTEEGSITVGDMHAVVSDAPATVWARSLDGNPIASSRRILVAHITDVQPKGSKYADEDMNILLSWGDHRRMVMRRGMAGISLRVAPGDYVVHALNADGTRRGVLPARMEDGRLRFIAS